METTRFNPREAALGAAAASVFPVLVVLLQLVQRPAYSPMRQAISELALGRDGWLMAVAFCSLAIGSVLLTRFVWSVTHARLATGLLAVAAALTALSAAVRADGSKTSATTLHGDIHIAAGIATFVCITVAMFLVAPRLRALPRWRPLGTATRVLAILCVPAFFLPPLLGNAHLGLAQRILVGLLVLWNIGTQVFAYRTLAAGAPVPAATTARA